MSATEVDVGSTEDERVEKWRLERFSELLPDTSEEFIQLLSTNHEIAPADLSRLLENGCSPDLAIKILI